MRLVLLFLFCAVRLQAQVAIIDDPEGFVNVREAADIKSAIRDTLHSGRMVEVSDSSGMWNRINIPKTPLVQGYVHRSRLRYVHLLSAAEQRKILLPIFAAYITWARNFNTGKETPENGIGDRMVAALGSFTLAWKNAPDTILLHSVFETLYWSSGSASEQRIWLAAHCALYHPELFKYVLCHEAQPVQEEVKNAINGSFELNSTDPSFTQSQYKHVMAVLESPCPFEIRNYDGLDNYVNEKLDESFALVYEGIDLDSSLTPAKLKLQTEGLAVLKNDTSAIAAFGYQFELCNKPFEKKNHILFFDSKHPGQLYAIDAAPAWGTEDDTPRHQLAALRMTYKGKTTRFDQDVVSGLYNTNHNVRTSGEFQFLRVYRSADEQRVYLRMYGSDGALGYVVIWIFTNGVYSGRVIEHGF